ncbi:DUF551 domain-containing protein [Escherichia marmotae]|nr:DUF551 domain-containing protein [Escherichia marmotae]
MSNKIENPVVLIHKRENHDSYAVAITNGSHDFYDGLLIASVSPDDSDYPFATFAMVGYYMAAEIEKLRAQRDALAAENVALRSKAAELAHEASKIYSAYNATITEPDGDFMDMQTLHEMQCIETPATDAFLAEVSAHGGAKALEDFAEFNIKSIDPFDDEYTEVLKETARAARCFAAMLQSQDSGIKDSWISCSERMPVIGELNWRTGFPLLVTCEIGVIPAYYGFVRVNGNKHYGFMESLKYGDDSGNHPQTNEYDLISNVTHWMPLPEPPQESKSE